MNIGEIVLEIEAVVEADQIDRPESERSDSIRVRGPAEEVEARA